MEKTTVKKRSQIKAIWFRFKKSRLAMIGLILFVVLLLVAIFAEQLADYETLAVKQNMKERLQSPSSAHILGTDKYGRDMFARIVHGARVSLFVGLITICLSLFGGSIIGAIAGYYGGKTDEILMRIMDVIMAIPSMLFAISIVAALGTGLQNMLIALSIAQVPKFARIVRSAILTVKDQDYIEAARACATTDTRIILKHIIPNAMGPIIVQATLNMAQTIITISSLSFVGLGVQAPRPEWGSMLSEGKEFMRDCPYLILAPGFAIMLAVMSLNLMGDGLRDALDPRLKN